MESTDRDKKSAQTKNVNLNSNLSNPLLVKLVCEVEPNALPKPVPLLWISTSITSITAKTI